MKKKNLNTPLIRKDLDEAVETILDGMDNMLNSPDGEIQKRFKSIDNRFGAIDNRFDTLEAKVNLVDKHLTDEINGLKADLSTTVSKAEFNQLKAKVDHFHPAS